MDENHLIKRIKQFSFILYMLFFYVFFLRKIVNKNDFQKSSLLIIFIYLFCNLVSHLFNGYEQERFMYQFLILHIIFISNFILNLNEKINEKKY
jgi:predicted neutral ceramidase superfamily lipid hydrolase